MKEKLRKLFTNVWNVPNVLTMFRLILIPVFGMMRRRLIKKIENGEE